ncbi:hypothetical protein [Bradyrhizobium sp. 173]|uniref:hypothetical protein n=1 Tax=Bradyrhizobium sp. 173 TaxID=2782644 RepID=UPI001FFA3918|nr:hypothetical protein [Bradyrhizobium sp. 173]
MEVTASGLLLKAARGHAKGQTSAGAWGFSMHIKANRRLVVQPSANLPKVSQPQTARNKHRPSFVEEENDAKGNAASGTSSDGLSIN